MRAFCECHQTISLILSASEASSRRTQSDNAASVLWFVVDRPGGRGLSRFVESKAAGPESGGKADPFGGHLLARLVPRPAVKFGRAKTLRRASAIPDRMAGRCPPVG